MNRLIRRSRSLGAAIGLLVAFNSHAKAALDETALQPSIEGETVTGVIERIKQDVAYYYSRENQSKKIPMSSVIKANKCAMRYFDFTIDKVKVELNVIQAKTVKGNLGLTVPFGPGGSISVGPGISGSQAKTVSNMLAIDLFPVPDPDFGFSEQLMNAEADPALPDDHKLLLASKPAAGPPPRVTPISDTLIALRNDLTAAAVSKPCLETLPRKGLSASDEIKIDFQVASDTNADVGFKLILVSIKPEFDKKDVTGNKLTISFSPTTGPVASQNEAKPRR